jgi:asparagine synthase (glutamine-hydrolysing)
MCGIVGLVAAEMPEDAARERVERMAARIHHRGPDGGGVASHPEVTVGMKRLAIVDVEHGAQPMFNEDRSVVLVFNGEIYNAPALRAELQREGVSFQTRSDTEVILRLYEKNPDDVERHLAGMWAFAIHDRRRRRVVLSRDRFGIKPLFVADTGTALAFASEMCAFDRTVPAFAPLFQVDPAAAHAMLSWSFVPETATIWRGVYRLAPASRLEIDLRTGRRVNTTYWHLAPSRDARHIRDLDEAANEVERLLVRSVREHLESDVPIATFLSGGIDSSLITKIAAELSPKRLRAYTIGFHEKRFDESPYAREAAARVGVDLEVEMFDEQKARAHVVDALLAYDEPFGDSSSLATYLVCNRISRDFKVALGGDGGDEVFAGYKKYLVTRLRGPFARFPEIRNAAGRLFGLLPTRTDRSTLTSELLRTARRLSRGLNGSDAEVFASLTQVTPLERTQVLVPAAGREAWRFLDATEARFRAASGSELERSLSCDLTNTLTNDMLVKVDRASMAHHLEARVPFLDHRLVEFGLGLPERFTLGTNGKRVLRHLHRRSFGRELAERKKRGFGVPVERWLRGPFDSACERLFERERLERFGLLSPSELSNGGHRRWATTEPMVLWHAFSLAAWCEANLGEGPEATRELIEQPIGIRGSRGDGSPGTVQTT